VPSFRNCRAPTRSPSRRSAVSHRIVAGEAGHGPVLPDIDADQDGGAHRRGTCASLTTGVASPQSDRYSAILRYEPRHLGRQDAAVIA